MRFHSCPTLALAGRKDRSKSLHRPTLPTISSTSTTLVPRGRRLLAASSLLRSSKESNLFEVCSLRIRAATARKRARRLARVKSASTCSFRSIYGIIFSSLLKIGSRNMVTRQDQGVRVSGLAFKWLLSGLPGRYEQDDVDQHGKGDAQYHAHQEPEKAPSAHPLNV